MNRSVTVWQAEKKKKKKKEKKNFINRQQSAGEAHQTPELKWSLNFLSDRG